MKLVVHLSSKLTEKLYMLQKTYFSDKGGWKTCFEKYLLHNYCLYVSYVTYAFQSESAFYSFLMQRNSLLETGAISDV